MEDLLARFVDGFIEVAARKKQREEDEKRREQERLEAERKRQDVARLRAEKMAQIKAEQTRVDSLLQKAKAWRQSENIREYIRASSARHLSEHGAIEPGGEFATWVEWASQQADRLDPLAESPPSILDERVEPEPENERRFNRAW
jgi:hypothetical protein